MCYKKASLTIAYENGLRRCPCCNVQLVWKANPENVQKNLATVDHMVPKSIGGGNISDNMFVMCRQCNNDRGDMCFVTFVTKRGVSKIEAENLYKIAHTASVRSIIHNLMNQVKNQEDRARYKKQVKNVVRNYKNYFKDYLPEFDLLPRDVCN